jgi:hypothetical protein
VVQFWYRQRLYTGQETDPTYFGEAEIRATLNRMYEEAEITLTMKNANSPKPSKLGWDYSKLPLFLEEFKTQLSLMHGAAHISELYLLREHDVITDEIRALTYQKHGQRTVRGQASRGYTIPLTMLAFTTS